MMDEENCVFDRERLLAQIPVAEENQRLQEEVKGLRDALEIAFDEYTTTYQKALKRIAKLEAAALALYEAAVWIPQGRDVTIEDIKKWENLRDALGLDKGYATEKGVGI